MRSKLDRPQAEEDDGLDDADRERLHAALDAAEADVQAGRLVPVDEVLARLRRALAASMLLNDRFPLC